MFFFVLSSCTFSPQEKHTSTELVEEISTELVEGDKILMDLIGYIGDIPIFRDFHSKNLYSFDGEFKYYLKGKSGFSPMYCNDSVMIFASLKDARSLGNEVIITKGKTEKKVVLPNDISWLVSNTNGDTLFYTTGDREVDSVHFFDVLRNTDATGTLVWYEGFWYSKDKFHYYILNEEDYRCYVYTTSLPPVEQGILLTSTPVDNLCAISSNGNYLSGTEKISEQLYCVINLKTGNFKRIKLEESSVFSFFYKNKAYFFESSTSKIIATINLDEDI